MRLTAVRRWLTGCGHCGGIGGWTNPTDYGTGQEDDACLACHGTGRRWHWHTARCSEFAEAERRLLEQWRHDTGEAR